MHGVCVMMGVVGGLYDVLIFEWIAGSIIFLKCEASAGNVVIIAIS